MATNVSVSSFSQSKLELTEEYKTDSIQPDCSILDYSRQQDELTYYKRYCQQLERQNASLNDQLYQNIHLPLKSIENVDTLKQNKQLQQQLKQKLAEESIWTRRYDEQLTQIIQLKANHQKEVKELQEQRQEQRQRTSTTCKSPNHGEQSNEVYQLRMQVRQSQEQIEIANFQGKCDEIEQLQLRMSQQQEEISNLRSQQYKTVDINDMQNQLEASEQCILEMRDESLKKDQLLQESIIKYQQLLRQYEQLQSTMQQKNIELDELKTISGSNRSKRDSIYSNTPKMDMNRMRQIDYQRNETEPDGLLSHKSISNLMARDQ